MSKHRHAQRIGRRHRIIAGAAALLLGAATLSSSATLISAATLLPDDDPFYRAPANIATFSEGQIVASRPSQAQVKDVLGRNQALVGAWQLSFRSDDAHGQPILAVTTLMTPKQAYTGPSKVRPMVTYATAEDSTGTQCAPSYTLANNTGEVTASEQNLLALVLQKGYILNIPDHEGPLSTELVGPVEGRIILDSVKAALAFSAAGTSSATPVGLWGYSAAGAAVGWAAELEASYAPQLATNIKGIAFGGAPSNLPNTLKALNGGPFSAFALAALLGIDKAYPELGLYGMLNAKGRALYAQLNQQCIADFALKATFVDINTLSDTPNVITQPAIVAALNRLNLQQSKPIAPIYYYYSPMDQAIPLNDSLNLWRGYCAAGVKTIASMMPLSEHSTGTVIGAPGALNYLANRLDGKAIMPWEPCHL